ncbi:hypothetical protein [Streptomyces mirabilis]|uniref:hypothetical protein n=1 Tax=Streptomyces mirabilis TaxID=68239 RepID=UPI0033CB9DEB
MPIKKSFVPSEMPGAMRAEYRVDGDSWLKSYPTREAAEKREVELNTEKPKNG